MRLHQNPSFRKVVIPWYDSDVFCIVISVFMALIFLFSKIGLRFALEHEEYQRHGWVPLVLMVLSGIVLATNLIRILTRMVRRRAEEK
ncbi:MAG: hypothetical protein JW883_04580 [Deltaproteobacteria bacterium]|jgi:hypothetical protein|nr:hypothetical protein [Deltaproteobacteria bacterium]